MKRYAFIILLLCAIFLSGVANTSQAAERSYIAPTFTTNSNGLTIGTTVKSVLNVNGKYYRDSNGNGTLEPFENWELTVDERVADLVSRMTIDQKIGLMIIGDRGSGYGQTENTSMGGILDEFTGERRSNFGTSYVYGTTLAIEDMGLRRFIFRQNLTPEQIATWNNAMQQIAEDTPHGIPVVIASNSRNENGDMAFGMNDASGVFSTWPGTLGLAAAAMGDIKAGGNAQLITDFAEISRTEWDATGIKKGYMYMADVVTDPRWQRAYGTLGERPDFVADAIGRLIRGFQGGTTLQTNGVGLTTKHFPGGGARENGFDPHYELGQWNVYATQNSLEKYHLPPFKAAIENNTSSIMPYYARPANDERTASQSYEGQELDLTEEVGFAYNKFFMTELLRNTMGHKGYINSDTGILGNMAWGMTQYRSDPALQAAYAVNAGTDIISGLLETSALKEAYLRSLSDDFKAIDSNDAHVLTEARINEAATRLLKEEFQLGLFENPYRDTSAATSIVNTARADARVNLAHQKSVVLLKNTNNTLPLSGDKVSGKKVYVKYFNQTGETDDATSEIKSSFTTRGFSVTDDYNSADIAVLFLNPSSGAYFNATPGYLELDICDGKVVYDVDSTTGVPLETTHEERTLASADLIKDISDTLHAKDGKVIVNVNVKSPWLLGNVEPYSDALTVGFDTNADAVIDVMTGAYNPTGVLPLTLPKDDNVIKVTNVNGHAICVSPNDVPGYDKDKYLPANLLDANGKGYAYVDSEGNYYESNFGLTLSSSSGSSSGAGSSSSGCNTGLSVMGLLAVIGLAAKIR